MRLSLGNHPNRVHGRSAFTLIELLVVIGIISILIGIALVLGPQVIGSGKQRQTEDVLRALDGVVGIYVDDKGGAPPSMLTKVINGASYDLPIIDARESNQTSAKTDEGVDSVARFIAAAADSGRADAASRSLSPKLVRSVVVGKVLNNDVRGTRVVDGWGNPIRFVHPAYDGGAGDYWNGSSLSTADGVNRRKTIDIQVRSGGSETLPLYKKVSFRRSYRAFDASAAATSNGDADEGLCPGRAPYFYSAGADGDAGARVDNVYINKPQWPSETATYLN